MIGSDATPADAASKFAWQRTSTSGAASGTAVTGAALDPTDPAALVIYSSTWTTTQPTIVAGAILQVAMNQRATFRWVAVPDGEMITGNTSGAGIALMSVVASATANYAWSVAWQE